MGGTVHSFEVCFSRSVLPGPELGSDLRRAGASRVALE